MRTVRNDSIASHRRAICMGFALLGLGGAAEAQVITEFSAGISAGSFPAGITAGPDGNLWFAEQGSGGSGPGGGIGRITPLGVVTEFKAGVVAGFSAGAQPFAITTGPDGNLWFTDINLARIGRITPAGVVTEFTAGIPAGAQIFGITTGPDGNLWYTNANYFRIGRITPAGSVTEFGTGITGGGLRGITIGPDGNLWFAEFFGAKIGRITPAGVITEFPICCTTLTPGAYGITAGPDGNLWFTEGAALFIPPPIARITTAGVVTEFSTATLPSIGAVPTGITAGPDGNLWFAEQGGNRIGRITPLGVITQFSTGITAGAAPFGITAGPDGNVWFTELTGNRIGRITMGVAGAPGFFPLPPCRVLDTRFAVGALGGPSLQPAGSADRLFVATSSCGIATDAVALSVNITVTNTGGAGYLSLYRGDGARTGTYSITFMAGQTRANNDILQLALDGSGSFKVQNSAPGNVDFILDVNGYFR